MNIKVDHVSAACDLSVIARSPSDFRNACDSLHGIPRPIDEIQIPYLNELVPSCGSKQAPVLGMPSEGKHGALVGGDLFLEGLIGAHVPDLHEPVIEGRGEVIWIEGAELQISDAVHLAVERHLAAAFANVPQLDRPVLRPRKQGVRFEPADLVHGPLMLREDFL